MWALLLPLASPTVTAPVTVASAPRPGTDAARRSIAARVGGDVRVCHLCCGSSPCPRCVAPSTERSSGAAGPKWARASSRGCWSCGGCGATAPRASARRRGDAVRWRSASCSGDRHVCADRDRFRRRITRRSIGAATVTSVRIVLIPDDGSLAVRAVTVTSVRTVVTLDHDRHVGRCRDGGRRRPPPKLDGVAVGPPAGLAGARPGDRGGGRGDVTRERLREPR